MIHIGQGQIGEIKKLKSLDIIRKPGSFCGERISDNKSEKRPSKLS